MVRKISWISILIVLAISLTACGAAAATPAATSPAAQAASAAPSLAAPTTPAQLATTTNPATSASTTTAPVPNTGASTGTTGTTGTVAGSSAFAGMESSLEQIYNAVNPSVVNVQVIENVSSGTGANPFGFGNGGNGNQQSAQALGSGFVWDQQGRIVTNNHVVAGSSSINVVFSDSLTVPAKVVGTDPFSDLAVIQVSVPTDRLHPVTLADSSQAKIGQLAIAIGNPYGLQGSMSVGIISGLQRSLPATSDTSQQAQSGPTYSIPDILQTDAAINPGNSGGVLLNDQGQVLGVTAAIESPVQANSGVAFVIPSSIVKKVIPALVQNGRYDHPYLGISGTTMDPQLAQAMRLNSDQRGVLVVQVAAGSPAEKAGLRPSNSSATIDGQTVPVGGDVIVSIDGNALNTIEDLIAYQEDHTSAGQTVTLGILHNGQPANVKVTLGVRPNTNPLSGSVQPGNNPSSTQPASGSAFLGISGASVDQTIERAMNLPSGQQGVLVVQVQPGSPAQAAGLHGGTSPRLDNGQVILTGGDVITAIDGHQVTSMSDLQAVIQQDQPGQKITLSVLRNGSQTQVPVTLGSAQ